MFINTIVVINISLSRMVKILSLRRIDITELVKFEEHVFPGRIIVFLRAGGNLDTHHTFHCLAVKPSDHTSIRIWILKKILYYYFLVYFVDEGIQGILRNENKYKK